MKLFVYGTLFPGEIAYFQIADLIDSSAHPSPSKLLGWGLYVRHGFPVAKDIGGNNSVSGALLHVLKGKEAELFRRLDRYEGDTYERYSTTAIDRTTFKEVNCETYGLAQKFKNSRDVTVFEGREDLWRSKTDPLLLQGIPIIKVKLNELPFSNEKVPAFTSEYWELMIPLQGIYLVLCSMLERLALFRCGDGNGESTKTAMVVSLAKDERFAKAFQVARAAGHINSAPLVKRDGREEQQVPSRCDSTLKHWYEVRGNLTHQGKSSVRDLEILRSATEGLLRTLEEYLIV